VFLTHLARRGLNERVQYRLVLGTAAPFTADGWDRLRGELLELARKTPTNEVFEHKFAGMLRDLDELVRDRGDGAVSVARGKLEGVVAVLVPRDHIGLVYRHGPFSPSLGSDDEHPVFAQVLRWLRKSR
jgi:hypothetical protein